MSVGAQRPGSTLRVLGATVLLGGVSCSDYAVEELQDDTPLVAELLVEPALLDLGSHPLGGTGSGELVLSNPGTVALELGTVGWSGSGAFSLLDTVEGVRLDAGEALAVEVVYSPSDLEQRALLSFTSPDLPDGTEVSAEVIGAGLIPRLAFEPDPLDFGGVVPGCESEESVAVVNVGSAPLTVESLVLQAGGFTLLEQPDLPLLLEEGERVELALGYAPEEVAAESTLLWAGSDDPGGARSLAVQGEGTDAARIEERFRQGAGPYEVVDFVFYVDQSGSMADNRRKLAEQSVAFMDHLVTLDLDWQIGVVTRSHGCANTVLSREAGNTASDFSGALTGPFDSSTEMGLYILDNAMAELGEGDCNEGLIREDSRAAVVFVSDEPDQSPETWDTHLLEILSEANGAMVAAIVGDVPDGCDTAEPGTGYVEAASATQGMFLSICESEWASYLEDFTDLVTQEPVGVFLLGYAPDPASISVEVDEEEVTGWTYDETLNAVVFDEGRWPAGGSQVLLSYVAVDYCG